MARVAVICVALLVCLAGVYSAPQFGGSYSQANAQAGSFGGGPYGPGFQGPVGLPGPPGYGSGFGGPGFGRRFGNRGSSGSTNISISKSISISRGSGGGAQSSAQSSAGSSGFGK
ncbi:keratin, type I cytoskeletal 10-like [Cydia splendana]|uniref:keratin, type I cytoskeletal 10-like n=1 Tax=Cydia splendana TaxID=1100963 RepID=UPI0028F487D4